MKILLSLITMFLFGSYVLANDGSLPTHFLSDILASFVFGLVLIVLVVIGYKLVDWALKGVNFDVELSKNNLTVGIVVASIILGICYGVSNVVAAILN